MNTSAWLIAIIKAAGVKLPLIWPHLLHIAADIKEIANILGLQPQYLATSAADQATIDAAFNEHNIDSSESQEVLDAFAIAAPVQASESCDGCDTCDSE